MAAPSRPADSPQDEKCDIIHKYNADEARNLKNYGEDLLRYLRGNRPRRRVTLAQACLPENTPKQ